MDGPDFTCYLEVTPDGTFVYGEKIKGPGRLAAWLGPGAAA